MNQGLSHYRHAFDVVHVRCVCTGIENYQHFLQQVYEVLRPGGILLTMEGDPQLLGEDFQSMTGGEESEPVSIYLSSSVESLA